MSTSYDDGVLPPLFHISLDLGLPTTMVPRAPNNAPPEKSMKVPDPEDWIFAENLPPRLSFSPDLTRCVQAIYPGMVEQFQSKKGMKEGVEFAVYRLDPRSKSKWMSPTDLCKNRKVWDAHVTQEYCFFNPVQIYFCGTVIVRLLNGVREMKVRPFNDPSLKEIGSLVPTGDDLSFRVTLALRGKMYSYPFF